MILLSHIKCYHIQCKLNPSCLKGTQIANNKRRKMTAAGKALNLSERRENKKFKLNTVHQDSRGKKNTDKSCIVIMLCLRCRRI